jgi:hypothetical protein
MATNLHPKTDLSQSCACQWRSAWPLERIGLAGFLSAVFGQRAREGTRAGIIAAAATFGALIGFGRAHGAALRPINAVAHVLLGERARLVDGVVPAVTISGLAVHIVSLLVWGTLFALIFGRLRGAQLLLAAFLFAAAAFVFDDLAPARLRPGFEPTLTTPERVAVYAILALALWFGLSLSHDWSKTNR